MIQDYEIIAVVPIENECFYVYYKEDNQVKRYLIRWRESSGDMIALWQVCKAAHDSLRAATISKLIKDRVVKYPEIKVPE